MLCYLYFSCLATKRKLSQHSRNSDLNNHLNNRIAPKTTNSRKPIMNGGILTKFSDDNLGEEDEIDCLVDEIRDKEDHELEYDGTLLRDAFENDRNNRLFEYRYRNGHDFSQQQHPTTAQNYRSQKQNIEKEGTLVPDANAMKRINENDLQNNDELDKRDSTPKNSEPLHVPRVQKIFEKGKANLSRSKSELGEQHRKVLSQINKGKSGITEQNRRLLANISSGMDKSKRFVLPGFNFSSSSTTKNKQYQGEKVNNASLDLSPEAKLKTSDRIIQNEVAQNLKNNDNKKMSKSTSKESINENNRSTNHIGEKVNEDLDQMLTNLGIQISAAEAATSDSICHLSSSKAPSSLMTQSVFVSSNNKRTTVENDSSYKSSTDSITQKTSHNHRSLRGCDSSLSYSSERSIPISTRKGTDQKRIASGGDFDHSNNNMQIATVQQSISSNIDNGTNNKELNDHKSSYAKLSKEGKLTEKLEVDDYLLLERSLENDYGEFDFIDGDCTLSRETVPSYTSNIGHADRIHKIDKISERKNCSNVSLLDEVVEEMGKEKDFFSCKENQGNQANVCIREKLLTKGKQQLVDSSSKKSRRLSSTSLSSASLSEQTSSYFTSYAEPINYPGRYAPIKSPLSSTCINSDFVTSTNSVKPYVSVYADHTLMLRSHKKRRRWLLLKSQNSSKKSYEYDEKEIEPDQTHLKSKKSIINSSLRRCSSLAQNFQSESSSDNSPYLMTYDFENRKNIVNGYKQFDNSDQWSQKLLLLNEISGRNTVFIDDSIDSDNNNSAINGTSWLSTSLSKPVKNIDKDSSSQSENCFLANAHDKYHAFDGSINNKTRDNVHTLNNSSSNDSKPSFRQKTRRSPWLLRSNLSNYARRRRGSSTSLHTAGLNEDETSKDNMQTSLNTPMLMVQNGATNLNISHDNRDRNIGFNAATFDHDKQNGAISNSQLSSFTDFDLPAVTENNSMSLNRR